MQSGEEQEFVNKKGVYIYNQMAKNALFCGKFVRQMQVCFFSSSLSTCGGVPGEYLPLAISLSAPSAFVLHKVTWGWGDPNHPLSKRRKLKRVEVRRYCGEGGGGKGAISHLLS